MSDGVQSQDIVLYGASGNALAARLTFCNASLSRTGRAPFKVVAYIDDFRGDQGLVLEGAPIISLETWRKEFAATPCAIAIGDPKVRRALVAKSKAAGGSFIALYEIGGWISPDVTIGEGTMLALTPTYVGPRVKIGEHCMIMQFVMISHDCMIGDYVTICPSVNISGHVIVEDDVYIGVGTSIVNGTEEKPLRIGRGAAIYAGSAVWRSVPAGARIGGNPARDLRSLVAGRATGKRRAAPSNTDC